MIAERGIYVVQVSSFK
ncbi:hypothetical protein [Lacrimispora sp.]|nr:hypothetical protein [Lacrimispora sp.]